ncbi:MAG: ABC transporter ATP-binding protein/permease, partial [Symbiobacteriaceae bacterium]|nr:ABC transporter ATP-binding protein/permease [Symbiobacteriaceae bacterium]
MTTGSSKHTVKEDIHLNLRSVALFQNLVPWSVPLVFSLSLCEAILPFINILMMTRIIDELLGARNQERLMLLVLLTISLNLALSLLIRGLTRARTYLSPLLQSRFSQRIANKSATMDFLHAENPRTQELRQFFEEGQNSMGGIGSHLRILGQCLQDIIAVAVSFSIVMQLFLFPQQGELQGLAAFIDSPASTIVLFILLLGAMAIAAWVNMRSGKMMYHINEINIPVNRKFNYLSENVFNDYRFGKDLRLYHMLPMMMQEMEHFISFTLGNFRRAIKAIVGYESLAVAVSTLIIGIIYSFVGLKAYIGTITIGSIVLYVGAISQFSSSFGGLIRKMIELRIFALYAEAFLNYLNLPQVKVRGCKDVPLADDGNNEIEFRQVSFRYPGTEAMILRNISMTINAGERLAVVGMNGAGKTTFIKLLCRLYDPTEGSIYLNGVDIREIDYEAYLKLFSVVFQDFKLLAFPVIQNVAASFDADRDKASQYLDEAGVGLRVRGMPRGMDTYIYRNFEEDGIEISGGE